MKDYTDIQIHETPFSRYGAYVSVCHKPGENVLTVHNVKRGFGQDEAFTLKFLRNNRPVDIQIDARPHVLHIDSGEGRAKIYIRDDYSLVIACSSLDVSLELLSKNGYGFFDGKNTCKVIDVINRFYAAMNIQIGTVNLDGPIVESVWGTQVNSRKTLEVSCEAGKVLIALEISQVERAPEMSGIDVDSEINEVRSEWSEFLRRMPEVPETHRYYSVLAWYTTWSSFVRANDTYHYDAMLMSKNHMSSVWSWDHCFNALLLSYVDP